MIERLSCLYYMLIKPYLGEHKMTAKITISSSSNGPLNEIASIFADVFEKYPEAQSNQLKFTVGKTPEMGVGIRPVTHIEILLENHSKEALEEIMPLLDVVTIILNKHAKSGADVKLTLTDDEFVSEWGVD